METTKVYEFIIDIVVNIHSGRKLKEGLLLERDDLPTEIKARFDSFIASAARSLTCNGFALTDAHWSNREGSKSYYYTAVKHSELLKADIKIIIFIRLSDHDLEYEPQARVDARNRYYIDQVADLTRNSGRTPKWELVNIVVNGTSVDSYRQALNTLDREVEGILADVYEQEET